MNEAYLEIKNLSKIFDSEDQREQIVAVDGFNLRIEKGEFITLLGPSGCGKTTTLRMIGGFESPTSGDVVLDGERLNDIPANKRDTCMVFQSYALFPHMNIFKNIAYGLELKKMKPNLVREKVENILELVGLPNKGSRAVAQLSGGEQQRVALARAIVNEPKVILFDEPLSNLDAKLRFKMRTFIRKIQRELSITSIYVTHDQEEAMAMSDRIVVMNQGRIEQIGTPEEIYKLPKNAFVADFIGKTTNFISAKVVANDGASVTVRVDGSDFEVPGVYDFEANTVVSVIIRPEMIRLSPNAGTFEGRINVASYLGSANIYEIAWGDQLLMAQAPTLRSSKFFREGERVYMSFLWDESHIIKAEA